MVDIDDNSSIIAYMDVANFKAILFDMDGTLLDSEGFYYNVWKSVLDEYGLSVSMDLWMNTLVGKTDEQAFAFLQQHHGFDIDETLFHARKDERLAAMAPTARVPLMPGAADLLAYLQGQGTTLALVTSSDRKGATLHLGHHGLIDLFSVIVTRDDVQRPKPDPEPYLTCMQQLGLPKHECLVLEDSATGARSAKAAGLPCFGVQSHEGIRRELDVDRVFDDLHGVLASMQAGVYE